MTSSLNSTVSRHASGTRVSTLSWLTTVLATGAGVVLAASCPGVVALPSTTPTARTSTTSSRLTTIANCWVLRLGRVVGGKESTMGSGGSLDSPGRDVVG